MKLVFHTRDPPGSASIPGAGFGMDQPRSCDTSLSCSSTSPTQTGSHSSSQGYSRGLFPAGKCQAALGAQQILSFNSLCVTNAWPCTSPQRLLHPLPRNKWNKLNKWNKIPGTPSREWSRTSSQWDFSITETPILGYFLPPFCDLFLIFFPFFPYFFCSLLPVLLLPLDLFP